MESLKAKPQPGKNGIRHTDDREQVPERSAQPLLMPCASNDRADQHHQRSG